MRIYQHVKLAGILLGLGTIHLDALPYVFEIRDKELNPVSEKIFGQFLERASWGEPGPEACLIDGTGELLPEVMEMLRKMDIPIIRFPGGTDVDFLDWRDMIDHAPGRDTKVRPVSHSRGNQITNRFGYDEYFRMRDELGNETILVLNFLDAVAGRKSIREASIDNCGLLAYANARIGQKLPEGMPDWPAIRALNGHPEPFAIEYIQIGNETWVGTFTKAVRKEMKELDEPQLAAHILECLKAYVEIIREIDPLIPIIIDAIGPFQSHELYLRDPYIREEIDFATSHHYFFGDLQDIRIDGESYPLEGWDTMDFWALWTGMLGYTYQHGGSIGEGQLQRSAEQADELGYKLAYTEWNWNKWGYAGLDPQPEINYEVAAGLGVAGFLHGFIRNGDRVSLATQSMLLGVSWNIAAIRMDKNRKVPPFFSPQGQVTDFYRRHAGDTRLEVGSPPLPRLPFLSEKENGLDMGSLLDVTATRGDNVLNIHVVNRSLHDPVPATFKVPDGVVGPAVVWLLDGDPFDKTGRYQRTHTFLEKRMELFVVDGAIDWEIPPHSVAVIRLGETGAPASFWEECMTAKDVWRLYPERATALLEALDLRSSGLGSVREAVDSGNPVLALERVVDYYRDLAREWKVLLPAGEHFNMKAVADVLDDTYTFQTVRDTVPRNHDGGLNWGYRGPFDDIEYGFFLNRHSEWIQLLNAFTKTGEQRYGEQLDQLIRDWVIYNPRPTDNTNTVQWRALEAGLRMGAPWPNVFYGFARSEAFTPAGLLLMLGSINDHATYLQAYHWRHHNHASMQMRGLAHVALAFPEFKSSEAWYQHSTEVMTGEMDYQFYPDGAQKELTSHYHLVSLRQFDDFAQLSLRAGRAVGDVFAQIREAAWEYLARSIRPSGFGLLNNDSDLDYNSERILSMAEEFNRPDWAYIVSNGQMGERPEEPVSAVFPWAGQLISRSGWDKEAHWSFFDAGPWGISHQHDDKLHLSISAFGRDLLVDSGRFRYIQDEWRFEYFLHSRSHNVILVDGEGQGRDVEEVDTPITNTHIDPSFDFVMADTGALFPQARHTRAMVYLRDRYWVVLDRIETEGKRTLSPLWHFHPECSVVLEGQQVLTRDAGQGNLRIKPIAAFAWDINLVKGRESPELQGWYSVQYNEKEPATCAVYEAEIEGERMFAWLLYPAKGAVPDPIVELISGKNGLLHVRIDDGSPVDVVVNFTGGTDPVQLPDGSSFIGRCAILGLQEQPLVAKGDLLNRKSPGQ